MTLLEVATDLCNGTRLMLCTNCKRPCRNHKGPTGVKCKHPAATEKQTHTPGHTVNQAEGGPSLGGHTEGEPILGSHTEGRGEHLAAILKGSQYLVPY